MSSMVPELEAYISFRLAQLSERTEHHTFETIEVVRASVTEVMRSGVHDVPRLHTGSLHPRYPKPRLYTADYYADFQPLLDASVSFIDLGAENPYRPILKASGRASISGIGGAGGRIPYAD